MQEVNKMSNFNEFYPNLTIENTVTLKKRRELTLRIVFSDNGSVASRRIKAEKK